MADVRRETWSAAEYHASDALSRSRLVDYEENPGLYRDVNVTHTRRSPAPSKQMRIGTMLHLAVLEPDAWGEHRQRLQERLVDKPEFTGKGARTRRREWLESLAPDAIPCTEKERDEHEAEPALVEEMARSILEPATGAARAALGIIEASEREVTYTWTDTDPELRAGPLSCRARLDLLKITGSSAHIADLKTTADPSPAAFKKTIANFLYHWQAPFYSAPVLEATGFVPEFGFICVRNVAPFEVAVYQLRPEHIRAAEEQVRRALRRLSTSIATNRWAASWEARPAFIDVPEWALKEQAA